MPVENKLKTDEQLVLSVLFDQTISIGVFSFTDFSLLGFIHLEYEQ